MLELTTLVPIRSRYENIDRLVQSWRDTTPGELVFILGPEEDSAQVHDALMGYLDSDDNIHVITAPGDTYPIKMNYGAASTASSWIFLGADDITFHPGWWEATQEARDAGYQVIGTNDLGNPRVLAGRHSTHTLVSRAYVERGTVDVPGDVVHRGYYHWFVDDELISTAKARGVWTPCLAAIVEHHHPVWGKAEVDKIYALGDEHKEEDKELFNNRRSLWYAAAVPFPHIVMDSAIPDDLARAVANEFPPPADTRWKRFDNARERKLEGSDPSMWGKTTRRLIDQLLSDEWCETLSGLTGIPTLVGDTLGGGYHCILPGGRLEVHADFNRHPDSGLYRRLNLLIFLNEKWQDAYGGQLELWGRGPKDAGMLERVQSIDPILSRMVIFSTSSTSYHGHPRDLELPTGRTRKSLAVYYFAPTPPPDYTRDHDTLFL